jgi:hypothetical protein
VAEAILEPARAVATVSSAELALSLMFMSSRDIRRRVPAVGRALENVKTFPDRGPRRPVSGSAPFIL